MASYPPYPPRLRVSLMKALSLLLGGWASVVTESPEVAAQSRGTVDKYHQIMEKSSVGARVCLDPPRETALPPPLHPPTG